MNSKQKLAAALKEENAPPSMIKRAEDGYYSDYDSPLETPCVQLVNDCHDFGLMKTKKRALNGEFDGTKEEADAWFEREGKHLLS